MFEGNGLALGLRRFRRSAVRFTRNLDDAVGLRELDGVLGELRLWAIGMPWVVESPSRERLSSYVHVSPVVLP